MILWTVLFIGLVILFVAEMRHSLKRSDTTARLVKTYAQDLDNPELGRAIYDYCQTDFKLRRIMDKHQATREDLDKLRRKLAIWGNFQKGRRLVPINSFFYAYTLDYLLSHRDEDPQKLAMRMMNFFHI